MTRGNDCTALPLSHPQVEPFIDGRFEDYVAGMRAPHIWGGESPGSACCIHALLTDNTHSWGDEAGEAGLATLVGGSGNSMATTALLLALQQSPVGLHHCSHAAVVCATVRMPECAEVLPKCTATAKSASGNASCCCGLVKTTVMQGCTAAQQQLQTAPGRAALPPQRGSRRALEDGICRILHMLLSCCEAARAQPLLPQLGQPPARLLCLAVRPSANESCSRK